MKKYYNNTFLTYEQVRVLRMKSSGMKFSDIARKLGKSRADIYVIYKAALKNVERSKRTLNLYYDITGGYSINLKSGIKLNDAIKYLLKEADKAYIKVKESSLDLLADLKKACHDHIEGETLKSNIKAIINKKGEVTFKC